MAKILPAVSTQTTRRRHLTFQILVVLAMVGFGLLTILVKVNPYLPLDLVVTRLIQSVNFVGFGLLMRLLTEIGNIPGVVILPALAASFLIYKRWQNEALMLLVSTGGAVFIGEFFKRVVARPRPDGSLVIQFGEYLKYDSFPSGHVLFFIGFFGFLAYLIYTRLVKNNLTKLLAAVLVLMIPLIGVSRIYLGAHWFSDVLGSYLIGLVWLYIVIQVNTRLKIGY